MGPIIKRVIIYFKSHVTDTLQTTSVGCDSLYSACTQEALCKFVYTISLNQPKVQWKSRFRYVQRSERG